MFRRVDQWKQVFAAVCVLLLGASLAQATGWEAAPPLNVARHAHGAAVDPCGNMWVLGGLNNAGNVTDSVEKLEFLGDTYANAWSPGIPMPEGRYGHAVAAVNGFVYVIGGKLDHSMPALASVARYDTLNDTWSETAVPPLNTARFICAATVDRVGRIWVVGGRWNNNWDDVLASVEVFDPARHERGWVYGPPLNEPKCCHGLVTDRKGRIYAIGGTTTDAFHSPTVERFEPCDPDAGWDNSLPDIPGTVSMYDEAVLGGDGHIYVAGGWLPGFSNRCLRYDPHTETWWQNWVPLTEPKNQLRLLLGADDRIYAIGGECSTSVSTVESLPTAILPGDINGDGVVNAFDIDPFVELLTGG